MFCLVSCVGGYACFVCSSRLLVWFDLFTFSFFYVATGMLSHLKQWFTDSCPGSFCAGTCTRVMLQWNKACIFICLPLISFYSSTRSKKILGKKIHIWHYVETSLKITTCNMSLVLFHHRNIMKMNRGKYLNLYCSFKHLW